MDVMQPIAVLTWQFTPSVTWLSTKFWKALPVCVIMNASVAYQLCVTVLSMFRLSKRRMPGVWPVWVSSHQCNQFMPLQT